MAHRGSQESPTQSYGHVHTRNRSRTAVYHHEIRAKLNKGKMENSEPIYDLPQGLTMYSRLKYETTPSAVTPAVGKGNKLSVPPKPIPRSKSTSANLTAITQDRQVQDDGQYGILVRPNSLCPTNPKLASSLYDIPRKKQPPKVLTKPKRPEHIYATVSDDRPIRTQKSMTLPRPSTKKRESVEHLFEGETQAPSTFRGASHVNEDEKTQPKNTVQILRQTETRSNSKLKNCEERIYAVPQASSKQAVPPKPKQELTGSATITMREETSVFIPKANITNLQFSMKGEFGGVFYGKLRHPTGKLVDVIVKSFKDNAEEESQRKMFEGEMATLSQIRHPNIVQVYGIIKEGNCIVMDFSSDMDLNNFLMSNPRPVRRLTKYMLDVAMGMHFLSEMGLVHRDLAARNILIGSPDETCKLSDIGLFRQLPTDDYYYDHDIHANSPVRWLAPEVLTENRFSSASDVWSYGILLREMFNPFLNDVPFTEEFDKLTMATVMVPDIPSTCPENIATLMKSCWQMDPTKRPTFVHFVKTLTEINFRAL